jgi:hypothetical protein
MKAEVFQICQLGFSADGSFRCAWPYLAVDEGIVAEISFARSESGETTFTFGEQSRFTSQLVKFSHHTSGIAQFSLTGKVRNDVRRVSFPLTGPIGRLFELHCFYPRAFKRLKRIKPRRLYLPIASDVPDGMSLVIKGQWRRKNEGPIIGRGDVGPVAGFFDRATGERGVHVYFAPPLDSPIKDHMLYLHATVSPLPKGVERPGLLFLGGFNMHEVQPTESTKDVVKGGLAAMYPVTFPSELRARISSIDLV